MDHRRRIYKLIEHYLNVFKKDAIEEFYGPNTYIKISSITFGIGSKSIIIECSIILGDIINESVLDPDMAITLINDSMVYFYPDLLVRVIVSWE